MKEKVTYYNIDGTVDKFSTWINANEWSVWVVFILAILVAGFIETL